MHSDGAMKLLVDRRTDTNDAGGVGGETMYTHEREMLKLDPLQLNFEIMLPGQTRDQFLPSKIASKPHKTLIFAANTFEEMPKRDVKSTEYVSKT